MFSLARHVTFSASSTHGSSTFLMRYKLRPLFCHICCARSSEGITEPGLITAKMVVSHQLLPHTAFVELTIVVYLQHSSNISINTRSFGSGELVFLVSLISQPLASNVFQLMLSIQDLGNRLFGKFSSYKSWDTRIRAAWVRAEESQQTGKPARVGSKSILPFMVQYG